MALALSARRLYTVIMLKRSGSTPKRPRDVNELAALIVAEATCDEPDAPEIESVPDAEPADLAKTPADDGKNPAAVALGKLGGKKGGKARMSKMTAEERSALGKAAAEARWGKGEKPPSETAP